MKYRYRESHEMKDSGVEWLGMIPKEWEVKQFKFLVNSIKNGTTETQVDNGELNVSRIETISNGEINFEKVGKINKFRGYENYRLNKGDFLLSHINSLKMVGNIALYIDNNPLYHGMNLLRIEPSFDYKYLYHIMKSKYFRNSCESIAKPAINQASISTQNLKSIQIPVTLKEATQQKIADFLDKKCEEFDSVIAKKEMLINKLEEAKKSLISEVVTGKVKVIQKENGEYGIIKREAHEMKDSGVEWLGVIPKEWQVSKLKYFANINPKKKEGLSLNEIVSFVPMESVKLGTITLNYTKKISEVINGYTYFENNDILLAKVTPCFENRNIGICENLINGIGFGSTELNAIRAKNNKDIKYLYYFLQEESFIKKGASTMTGTGGLKRIPTEFLYNCPIPYCKKDEKIKMTGFLDKKCSQFTIAIEKQKESIEKLKSAKQSLISEAITGKIEVL